MSRCFQRMKERLSTLGWTTETYLSYGSGEREGVSIPSTSLYTRKLVSCERGNDGRVLLPVIAQFELVPFRVVDLRSVSMDILKAGALPPCRLAANGALKFSLHFLCLRPMILCRPYQNEEEQREMINK